MPDSHANLAYGTVLTAPSPATTGTSLTVSSGQGAHFPTPPFNATVWPAGLQPLTSNAEIVRVTAISTDTFTITRHQEGTSARAILVTDQIAATITAKTLTDVETLAVGGDLTGNLPTLSIAAGAVTTTKLAAAVTLDAIAAAHATAADIAVNSHKLTGVTAVQTAGGDLNIDSDTGASGTGDIVFTTDGVVERLRITNAGLITVGSGDNFGILTSGVTPALQKLALGTVASPDGGLQPVLKVTRVLSMASTVPTGDGSEQLAAINGIAWGNAANQVQPVGIFGGAKNSGTVNNGGAAMPDAVGVYGVGDILSGGVGSGIGGVFAGRKESGAGAAARARGLEIASQNYTGVDDTWPGGTTSFVSVLSSGIHIDSQGTGNSAVAIAVNHSSGTGKQFDVGLGFTGENNGGTIGPVKTTTIQDDSNAVNSLLINGTHTVAVGVKAGAGAVRIGQPASAIFASSLLEVYFNGSASPIATFSGQNATDNIAVVLRQGAGSHRIFVAGSTNSFLTGTAQGDAGILPLTAGKAFHIGGTASVIKVGHDNSLTIGSAMAMGANKITGLAAATANGDAVRYEQIVSLTAGLLTPTAVKTTNYTAAAGDFVPCDTATTGSFTVTLPTAPADFSTVGVKMVKSSGTRTVTVTAGGTDVINVAGVSSLTITLGTDTVVVQYQASSGIWYVLGRGIGPQSLDTIATANATAGSVAMNSNKLTGLSAGTTNGDSVRYEQAMKSGDSVGGDLTGTLPNPSIRNAKVSLAKLAASVTIDALPAPGGDVAMATFKLTGLGAGSAAGHSVRWEQVLQANSFYPLMGQTKNVQIFGPGTNQTWTKPSSGTVAVVLIKGAGGGGGGGTTGASSIYGGAAGGSGGWVIFSVPLAALPSSANVNVASGGAGGAAGSAGSNGSGTTAFDSAGGNGNVTAGSSGGAGGVGAPSGGAAGTATAPTYSGYIVTSVVNNGGTGGASSITATAGAGANGSGGGGAGITSAPAALTGGAGSNFNPTTSAGGSGGTAGNAGSPGMVPLNIGSAQSIQGGGGGGSNTGGSNAGKGADGYAGGGGGGGGSCVTGGTAGAGGTGGDGWVCVLVY